MRETFTISAGNLRAEIVPSLGAGLARFDVMQNGGSEPIFRPWPERGTDDPNALAAYVLVPWSNRISGGGFEFDGRFHPLGPNFPPEPFPLHGNAWTSEWTLIDQAAHRATLELASGGPGPFRYLARLTYELTSEALSMRMEVTNRAEMALPYGLGFHPWFPRTDDVLLYAAAEAIWLEDQNHLPTSKIPVSDRPGWNFASTRRLPAGWVNNAFVGWDGTARIEWPSRSLSLSIEVSPTLGSYILYSPGDGASFFCFEPVSHVVDAHNLPGGAKTNNLTILSATETAEVSCRFSVQKGEA
jgi:aldose 1-epimerase